MIKITDFFWVELDELAAISLDAANHINFILRSGERVRLYAGSSPDNVMAAIAEIIKDEKRRNLATNYRFGNQYSIPS